MSKILGIYIICLLLNSTLIADINLLLDSNSEWSAGSLLGSEIRPESEVLQLISDQQYFAGDEFFSFNSSYWQTTGTPTTYTVSGGEIAVFGPGALEGSPVGIVGPIIPIPERMEIEASMSSRFGVTYSGGLILTDANQYLTVYIEGNKLFAKKNGINSNLLVDSSSAFIKMKKDGNVFKIFYRLNQNSPWLAGPTYYVTFQNTRMALGRINSGPAVGISFDYIRCTPYSAVGSWASPTYDLMSHPTTIGRISWEQDLPAGTSIEIRTSSSPDQVNWSLWSEPYPNNFGSQISSPPNRWLKVMAKFTSDETRLTTPTLKSIRVTYPTTVPLQPILKSSSHASEVWSKNQVINTVWQMPDGNPAQEASYTFTIYKDGVQQMTDPSPLVIPREEVGLPHYRALTLTAEGSLELRLQVKADDFSGGAIATPVSYFVKHDRSQPSLPVISSPTHPELLFTNNNSPVFELASTDALSGVSGYAAALDKLNYGDPGNSITHWNGNVRYLGLDNGTYYLHAKAVDAAGNTGPVGHYGIRVNFYGGLITEENVKVLPNPVRSDAARMEYELASLASEVQLELLNGQGSVLMAAPGAQGNGKNYHTWDVGTLANGTYFFRVKAKSADDGKTYVITKKVAVLR